MSTDLGSLIVNPVRSACNPWDHDYSWVFVYKAKRRWEPNTKNCPCTKEDLDKMYETMNMREMAEKLGVNKMNICNWMKAFNIPRRGRGRASSITPKP